jgi:hypothetical protein
MRGGGWRMWSANCLGDLREHWLYTNEDLVASAYAAHVTGLGMYLKAFGIPGSQHGGLC